MDQESVGGLTVALLWLCHTDRLSFEMLISGYGLSCVPFLNSDDKDGNDYSQKFFTTLNQCV